MSTDGSVIVAKKKGAMMGLTTRLMGEDLAEVESGTGTLQCRANQASPTPDLWKCGASYLNSAGTVTAELFPEAFDLIKVNPLGENLCSVFFSTGPGE